MFIGEGCVAISLWLIQSVVIFGKTSYLAFIYLPKHPSEYFSCHSYGDASKIQDSDQLLLAQLLLAQLLLANFSLRHDVGFSDLVSGSPQFYWPVSVESYVSFASTALI